MLRITSHSAIGLICLSALSLGIVFAVHGDVLDGTDRADVMTDPSPNDTVIHGLAGNDMINFNDPNSEVGAGKSTDGDTDTIFAGPGDDSILSGPNDDDAAIFGEDGNDTIRLTNEPDGPDNEPNYQVDGGRGDDLIILNIQGDDFFGDATEVTDGPGEDVIISNAADFPIRLVADNEQDTVKVDGNTALIIELTRDSGRDIIDCGFFGTIFLNGNRKAVDPKGNNLREAALLGGTAESGCQQIIP